MNTNKKCRAIIEAIRDLCNKPEYADNCPVISFCQDWGDNSLTVQVRDMGHTHIGSPDSEATFERLVDDLYDLLIEQRGLSFVN